MLHGDGLEVPYRVPGTKRARGRLGDGSGTRGLIGDGQLLAGTFRGQRVKLTAAPRAFSSIIKKNTTRSLEASVLSSSLFCSVLLSLLGGARCCSTSLSRLTSTGFISSSSKTKAKV